VPNRTKWVSHGFSAAGSAHSEGNVDAGFDRLFWTIIGSDPSLRAQIWDDRDVDTAVAAPDASADQHRSGAQTVERAIAILNLYRDDHTSLSITTIAKLTSLNLSTAHRLVRTLVQEHFMEQDPSTEQYRLGTALAVLGQRALQASGVDVAKPALDRLAEATGETVSLGARRGPNLVVLLHSSSRQALRFEHPSGTSIDVHASAMGKALMAFGDVSLKNAANELGRLERFTPSTITTQAALVNELERARTAGFAVNHQERYEGVCGVAAPVLDGRHVAHFALGIQGPSVRLTDELLDDLGRQLVETADEIATLVLRER
jgi:IclR family acetate operon transcriptional repressor